MNKFGLVLAQIFKCISVVFCYFAYMRKKIDKLRGAATKEKITLKEPRK